MNLILHAIACQQLEQKFASNKAVQGRLKRALNVLLG